MVVNKLVSSFVNYGDWWRGLSAFRKISPALIICLVLSVFCRA